MNREVRRFMQTKVALSNGRVEGSKGTAQALLANPFDRFDLGKGVYGWVYEYVNRDVLPIPHLATGGFEVAVQLRGDWWVDVWGAERLVARQGDVFVIPPYQCHTYRFRTDDRGIQVGFGICGHERDDCWRDLTCAQHRPRTETAERFRELAWSVYRSRREAVSLTPEVVRRAILDALVEQCDLPKNTPVERARKILVETADRPLYLHHIAEETGLHPKTLMRRVHAVVGATPIRFRTQLRLQRAIRLLWSQPNRSIASIGVEVGIEDARRLHRLMRSTFGLSAAQLGRRSPADPAE